MSLRNNHIKSLVFLHVAEIKDIPTVHWAIRVVPKPLTQALLMKDVSADNDFQ